MRETGRASAAQAALKVKIMDSSPASHPPVVRRTAAVAQPRAAITAAAAPTAAPTASQLDSPAAPDAGGSASQAATVDLQGGPMSGYVKPLQEIADKAVKQGEKLLPFLHHPDVAAAHQRIVDAVTLLQAAAGGLLSTPFDPKAKAAKAGIYAGAIVKITSRSIGHYAGLFHASDRFTVISLHGSRVLTEGPNDNRIFFGLKEIEIAAAPVDDGASA